ncbi:hypothetical protein SAMN04488103_101532 [Gemmobacter aquatilis]|uniref:DUF4142 domain-containing protein n=1 Tax=Gemmobacter aquatilis TaxID=933059 RepID=A0A1H7ZHP1_9RHOB|nr:hypothetical protein [Gemmobacter aquatilis]SEM57846.1 hypothetical protein SAMN04488103_101532 [Gemmobacter aquatilis]
MKRIAIIALAAVVAASGASASVTNPGKAQIAAQLGLDASEYSSTELSLIAKARKDADHKAEAFYLSHTNREVRDAVGQVNPGKAQIAAQLGLDPAEFTSAELSLIAMAREDGDHQAEAFYLSHTNRQSPEDASIVTPAKAQIAAQLGVDASAYTSAQLAQLSAARSVADE